MTTRLEKSNPPRRNAGSALRLFASAVAPRSRNKAWTGQVQRVIADLEKLNRSTEAGFLAVGSNLMAFLTASRQLHSDIGALMALVSGEHAQHACDALVSVRGFVQEMQHRSHDSGCAFLALQAAANGIHRRFSTLGKIALSFQVTAVLARIETAHLALSQQDLGSLAAEVSSCGEAIQSRVDLVLETSAAFDSRVASTLQEASRLDAVQQKELPALLAEVDADLERFEARQRAAAEASSKLASDLDSVAQDLGEIATSLQFHDITRQQVEHVIEALTVLLKNAAGGALSPSSGAVTRVQIAQLKTAASAFAASTERIDHGLEDIAARVGDMATASQSILGLDRSQQDSFLSDMQRRFEEVLRTVRESHALECAGSEITTELDALGQRLRSSVQEVQTIELQLSRISINAAISASHIGERGDPLNVVACAMQSLQNECASRSGGAETDLDSIGGAIGRLSAGAGNAGDAMLLDDVDARLRALRSASASSVDAASAVAAAAANLCGNLRDARDHAGIGSSFGTAVDLCCDALDEVAGQASPSWWRFGSPAIEEPAESRYTMQSERDIHDAVTRGLLPQPPAAPSAGDAEDVEFF
jgi:hypothetical protein